MSRIRLPFLLLVGCAVAAPPVEGSADVTIRPGPRPNTSEGAVELGATPAEVYAVVTDYARWPAVFSGVRSAAVTSGGPRDAVVEIVSRKGKRVTLRFDNVEPRVIRFRLVHGPSDVASSGEFVLEPIAGGTRTRVRGTLYLDVDKWYASDARVRGKRDKKLRRDLGDLSRRFP